MAREAPTTQLITGDELAVDIGQHHVRDLVRTENRRQLQKWGVQQHDPSFWFLILMEEMGELAAAILSEDTAHTIPPEHRGILLSASNLGAGAQMVLEGKLPDRINMGSFESAQQGHNSGEETIHVAAVAVAMEESRRRMIVKRGESAAVSAW